MRLKVRRQIRGCCQDNTPVVVSVFTDNNRTPFVSEDTDNNRENELFTMQRIIGWKRLGNKFTE